MIATVNSQEVFGCAMARLPAPVPTEAASGSLLTPKLSTTSFVAGAQIADPKLAESIKKESQGLRSIVLDLESPDEIGGFERALQVIGCCPGGRSGELV
jgi:hypothetical protein